MAISKKKAKSKVKRRPFEKEPKGAAQLRARFKKIRKVTNPDDNSSSDSIVIGAPNGTYYYVREENGKYVDGAGNELPTIPEDGTAVLDTLTRRGGLLSHISSDDAPGLGSFCYLISVENLKNIGKK